MLYRIWTEDKNREAIVDIVKSEFDAFSVLDSLGYWRGVPEQSLVIEINEPLDGTRVEAVARRIKEQNKQDAVLVQKLPIESELV